MRNVWELLIAIFCVIILAGILFLLFYKEGTRPNPRNSCASNLRQIGEACMAYQEFNGGYFPAFMQGCNEGQSNPNIPKSGQGSDYTFQPMPSLACLYPQYVDNVKVFACPSTNDYRVQIAFRYYAGARHTCFGFDPYADETGMITNNSDPAAFTGSEVSGNYKCSYFYDELTDPRKIGPDQAIACDADGMTWLTSKGLRPPYPAVQKRTKKPNHDTGQNVMYYDGHVKWKETVCASADPNDNIFCPNSTDGVQWHPDSDAYLWDGVDARAVQP